MEWERESGDTGTMMEATERLILETKMALEKLKDDPKALRSCEGLGNAWDNLPDLCQHVEFKLSNGVVIHFWQEKTTIFVKMSQRIMHENIPRIITVWIENGFIKHAALVNQRPQFLQLDEEPLRLFVKSAIKVSSAEFESIRDFYRENRIQV